MAQYLKKYVGTYRVKAEYDHSINDFPRVEETGYIESKYDDLYLTGRNGIQIFHHGGNVLMCYFPTKNLGTKIAKEISKKYPGKIFDVRHTDEEVTFKFKAVDIEVVDEFVKIKRNGANISPFSVKNLPKKKYVIPRADLAEYQARIASIPKGDLFIVGSITKCFDKEIISKMPRGFDIKADKRAKCLKGKEYIHSLGMWDDFLVFVSDQVQKLT